MGNRYKNESFYLYVRFKMYLQYRGIPTSSEHCLWALGELVQNDKINKVIVLTHENVNAMLVECDTQGLVIIPSGFADGYGGNGALCLAKAIYLLRLFNVYPVECKVTTDVIDRIDNSSLTDADVNYFLQDGKRGFCLDIENPYATQNWSMYDIFPHTLPFHLIHDELIPDVIKFTSNHDNSVMSQFYAKFEDYIKNTTKYKTFNDYKKGLRQNQQTKQSKQSKQINKTDLDKEADLDKQADQLRSMIGFYWTIFRNPRQHGHLVTSEENALMELLMVNNCFHWLDIFEHKTDIKKARKVRSWFKQKFTNRGAYGEI